MELSRQTTARIREVLEKHPEGLSITDLVKSVDINRNTAGRYLENLLLSGQVEMRRFGMAKMYTLAKRLPVSSVLSLSPELVMQLDLGQRVIYANEPLLTFLGAPAKDLFGKNIEFTPFSIVFEDVFSGLIDRFGRGLKGEEWRGEFSRPVQGRFFFCRVTPSVSNEGKKGVLVLLEDITDQKRDEERIRKSEERYRSLAEASQDLIFVIKRDDRVEYVNSYAAATLGFPADQVIGQKRSLLFSGEQGQRQAQALRRVFEMGKAGRSEGTMEIFGTLHWFDHFLTPIMDANGMITSVLGVSRDITDRQLAEEQLRQREQQYRFIADNSLDIINLQTPDYICTYVSPAITPLLGYPEMEVVGRSLLAMVHPDDLGKIPRDLAAIAQNGVDNIPLTFRLRHRDGHYRWFETMTKIIRDEKTGQVREFLSISRDITARKQSGKESGRI